jgi:hypothetical protein
MKCKIPLWYRGTSFNQLITLLAEIVILKPTSKSYSISGLLLRTQDATNVAPTLTRSSWMRHKIFLSCRELRLQSNYAN